VVTELPLALSLAFPPAFASLIDFVRVLMLDVFAVLHIDCLGSISLHGKFAATMAIPWVCVACIRLIQCIANRRVACSGASSEEIAKQLAQNQNSFAYRVFFIIFLIYPLLSKTVFHIFLCQTLGPGERWHIDDFSVDVRIACTTLCSSL
jgi:hypothetical protein